MTLVSSRERFKTLSDAQQQEKEKGKMNGYKVWPVVIVLFRLLPSPPPSSYSTGDWYCREVVLPTPHRHSPDTIDHLRVRARVKRWGRRRRRIDRSAHLNRLIPRASTHTHTEHTLRQPLAILLLICFVFLFSFLPFFLFSFLVFHPRCCLAKSTSKEGTLSALMMRSERQSK